MRSRPRSSTWIDHERACGGRPSLGNVVRSEGLEIANFPRWKSVTQTHQASFLTTILTTQARVQCQTSVDDDRFRADYLRANRHALTLRCDCRITTGVTPLCPPHRWVLVIACRGVHCPCRRSNFEGAVAVQAFEHFAGCTRNPGLGRGD